MRTNKVDSTFIDQMKRRVSEISVAASSLRNQGAPGVVGISRSFFYNEIDLNKFRDNLFADRYAKYLDKMTIRLVEKCPVGAKNWGAARKGLNLFFREVVYNRYLTNYLQIDKKFVLSEDVLKSLEVPLDSDVATGLKEVYQELPSWKSIKTLDKSLNNKFQEKAQEYAIAQGTIRVHLDLDFWRQNR